MRACTCMDSALLSILGHESRGNSRAKIKPVFFSEKKMKKLARKKIKQVCKKIKQVGNGAHRAVWNRLNSRQAVGFYLALTRIWGVEDPFLHEKYQA